MTLIWLIIIPLVGGLLAWFLARWGTRWSRWISLIALAINLVLVVALWAQHFGQVGLTQRGPWLVEFDQPWILQLGISFHLAMDGLSLLLLVLTEFLGMMAVGASWTEIEERVGFFHFSLLWVLAGITGVFLALDLFLFYFFWEMMLVPMFLLILLWGHERRVYAAIKFFIFTQVSGLLMLVAILGLYFVHGQTTGVYTFDYIQLLGTSMTASTAMWLMLGFLIAFAVKLPVVPVHTWLPDAHTEAPTAGSVILAGLLLKTGAYGLLRFVVPLFPQAASAFAPMAMALAVIGILYGAILAFAQTDLKRLVAYTSISHMGFVLLGIFAWNELALQGVVMQIIAHGISTGALFILVGALQERAHTRDMGRLGGLWSTAPRMGGVGLLFALASLGLPGLGNFVGEFLVLLGAYQVSILLTVLATVGLITATVYSLWMIQQTFHGPNTTGWRLPDLGGREMAIMAIMIAVIIGLGLYPQPVLNTARPALDGLQRSTVIVQQAAIPTLSTQIVWPQLAFYVGSRE
jgi:NADH-quinone oxidoreductase subunit M